MKNLKVYTSFFIAFLSVFIYAKDVFAEIQFTISNPTVSSGDIIEVDATITGLTNPSSCSTTGCYLQAQLRTADNTKNFFGFTNNNSGEFVDYFNPISEAEIKTKLYNFVPSDAGTWTGKLKAKGNPGDSNYSGPGTYNLKFRRFTGNSTIATSNESNVLTVTLAGTSPTPSPTLTPTPSLTPTPGPSNTPTSVPTNTSTPTPKPTMTNTPSPSLSPTISPAVNLLDTPQDESVLTFSDTFGNENVEATPEVLGSKVENEENTSQPFPWLAALFTIGGVGLVIYALIPFLKKDNNVSHPDEKQENN